MLDAAAVLRGDLSAQLLRAVTGLPSARLAAAIEELIGRRLLRAPTPDTLEFPHEFTARVAYERLTPEQRTALHARAASALAAHAPPDETVPSMVAYHRDLAGLPKSNGRRARVAAFAGAGMLIAVIVAVGLRWLGPVTGRGASASARRGLRQPNRRGRARRRRGHGGRLGDAGSRPNRARAGRRSPERPSGRDDGARRGVEHLRSVQR